jgi:hypothetical protein
LLGGHFPVLLNDRLACCVAIEGHLWLLKGLGYYGLA